MSEHRTYTCLACSDRPVFHGKIGAYFHLRTVHAAEMEERHPDELLAEGPEFVAPEAREDHAGPYICLIEDDQGECGQKRINLEQMESHIRTAHDTPGGMQTYGDHFISELDYADRTAAKKREREHLIDQACDRFFLTMQSVRTVSDFLTECKA